MFNKKTIINEMLRPDWNAELDECRDKEKFLLQILREIKDTKEVLEICEAIGPKGSLFATPVLMAKMTTTKDEIRQSYYMAALAIIMGRMRDWELGPENDFFNPSWWKIKWIDCRECKR